MKKRIELYVNSTKPDAKSLSERMKIELLAQGYEVVNNDADIVIGFGGDGTLLHFLRENNYVTRSKYIGINCGTLGFLQDFNVQDVKEFVLKLDEYVEQSLKFIEIEIENSGKTMRYKALNEFTIQDAHDKSFRTSMSVGNEFLENFVGTGLIFSTPTGSTALNLSAGGAIIHPNIEVIQITPREAITNSKMHCLSKSICIPSDSDITLKPSGNVRIKISSDCECVYEGEYNNIRIHYSNDGMLKLKDKKDSFIKTIREKLI